MLSLNMWTTGMIDRMTSTNNHCYSYATTLRTCVLFEEPLFTIDNLETMKLVMGGEPMLMNPKGLDPYVGQSTAVVIMTCEKLPWNMYDGTAFENRSYIYHFKDVFVPDEHIDVNQFWSCVFEINPDL